MIVHRNRLKLCFEQPTGIYQEMERENENWASPVTRYNDADMRDRSRSQTGLVAGYTNADIEEDTTVVDEADQLDADQSDIVERRSRRTRAPPMWYGDFVEH